MESMPEADIGFIQRVANLGQENVIAKLDTSEKLHNFISDLKYFESFYPGGLESYLSKMKDLLKRSSEKQNPLKGWIPSIPETVDISFNTEEYHKFESAGISELQSTGFVLVAGGLGERLGFNNIKVSLPVETFTMLPYLGYYIKKILAIQDRIPEKGKHLIPFAIMTSDNNHKLTMDFLESNKYFGMKPEQLFIMKQDVVPSVMNMNCELAVKSDGHLICKPHGHGDVHFCLYRDHVIEKWISDFHIKHVFFFQDTNALSFYTMSITAAIAVQNNVHMITTCVKRCPHEAAGGICRLTNSETNESLVCNVEYNQLEDVLKAVDERGDYADETGYSPYPGNSNIIYYNAEEYFKVLCESKGIVPEFVNPKYKSGSKTEYAQPTRLESMMQDYPWLLLHSKIAGLNKKHMAITYPRKLGWSPVKNSPARAREMLKKSGHAESAASGESDLLDLHKRILLSINDCPCCNKEKEQRVIIEEGAHVVLYPEAGCTTEEVHRHIGKNIVLKKDSLLIVKCRNWYLSDFTNDGCCILSEDETEGISEKSELLLEKVSVTNKGWRYVPIDENDPAYSVVYQMRGYIVGREEQCEFILSKPGIFQIESKNFSTSCKVYRDS